MPNDAQMKEYLAHHGTKGQKWGVKHGPPYPLDEKSKEILREKWKDDISEEEKEARKKDVIATADAKAAYNNRYEFTSEEIQTIINRVTKENELLSKIPKDTTKSGLDKLNEWATKANSVADSAQKIGNVYNTAAAVSNAFFDTELPKIDFNNLKSGKKPEEKKDRLVEAKKQAELDTALANKVTAKENARKAGEQRKGEQLKNEQTQMNINNQKQKKVDEQRREFEKRYQEEREEPRKNNQNESEEKSNLSSLKFNNSSLGSTLVSELKSTNDNDFTDFMKDYWDEPVTNYWSSDDDFSIRYRYKNPGMR